LTRIPIGEFAQRTRLSRKALRIYDELNLVVPTWVDPGTGYRYYSEDQVARARLVGLLRRLDMPLATIAAVVDLDRAEAAAAIQTWWDGVEATTAERRALLHYLQKRQQGEDQQMHEIAQRSIPGRTIASVARHVNIAGTETFFDEAFRTLRAAGPGIEGIAGVPFLVFYGEVSDDSDGPIELCRPIRASREDLIAAAEVQVRVEAAHDEVYVRLSKRELSWPAMVPVLDALERWTAEHHRRTAGTFRQLLIADQRAATADTLVCDLTVPLR
jgi:DNA-binding transcriptional MerR regulator